MNKRQVGGDKESEAAKYLTEQGYKIERQNFYASEGEIDIIARDGAYLCFVEVKYRNGTQMGFPQESVNLNKMRRISRTARAYCYKYKIPSDTPMRFDVVAMTDEEILLIKNAFEYTG